MIPKAHQGINRGKDPSMPMPKANLKDAGLNLGKSSHFGDMKLPLPQKGATLERGGLDLSHKSDFADADLPAKKPPMLAIKFGQAKDPMDDDPDAGEDVDDKGADDTEAALTAAGDAAMEAIHANDSLAFIKAIVAGVHASGGHDAADLDMGDGDAEDPEGGSGPKEPWSAGTA